MCTTQTIAANQFAEVDREIETEPFFSNDVPAPEDLRLIDCDIDDAFNEIVKDEVFKALNNFNQAQEAFVFANEEFERIPMRNTIDDDEHIHVREAFNYAIEVLERTSEELKLAVKTYRHVFHFEDEDEDEDEEEEDEEDDIDIHLFHSRTTRIDNRYEQFCCLCDEPYSWNCSCGEVFRFQLMNGIRFRVSQINKCNVAREAIRNTMRNTVHEDLIATVMHPCRIQSQMNQFDDIESYFTAIGY